MKKSRVRSNASHNGPDVNTLQNTINQLRAANKNLLEENQFLKSKCVLLESELTSAQKTLSIVQCNCAELQNNNEVLKVNLSDVSNSVSVLKEDNGVLTTKIETLNLQLSKVPNSKKKISTLKAEVSKLNYTVDILKRSARKFEVQLKENILELSKCNLEKEKITQRYNSLEESNMQDYNNLSLKYMMLLKYLEKIRPSTDPPINSFIHI